MDQYAVFDTETTGVDVAKDRIIQAFLGLMQVESAGERAESATAESRWAESAGERAESAASDCNQAPKLKVLFDSYINPQVPIPAEASAVHGITNEKLNSGELRCLEPQKAIGQIADSLHSIIQSKIPLVVYNCVFDLNLLLAECARWGVRLDLGGLLVIDPLILDKHTDKYRRGSRRLLDVCQLYNIKLKDAHSARADALASGQLAAAILHKYATTLPKSLQELTRAQEKWGREQAASFEAYLRKKDPKATVPFTWPIQYAA